jgi:3-deoxy-manno-octulosonate cytidylyltransferase (CMP-KDO synthetase)
VSEKIPVLNLHFINECVNYIMPRAVVIIPARFSSTRFPGKPLATLHNKPIIQHVYEQSVKAKLIESVIIATDDKRIFEAVTGFGGRAVMTSAEHECGTDRIAEVAQGIDCDIIVNVQGDEPFMRPQMIDDVVSILTDDNRPSISTLVKRTSDTGEIMSPNVVKVVTDKEGFALYFSRSPIPYDRDAWNGLSSIAQSGAGREVLKHIGIYGYRKDALMKFTGLQKSGLENIERLEQLRALDAGMRIKVRETAYDTLGIDTVEDLRKAEEWLSLSL